MKKREDDRVSSVASGDDFVQTVPTAGTDPHISTGDVLWTLANNGSTAQARRWTTASGFELELQIWTGPRVAGDEDLCWTQLFPSESALAEAAQAKKQQLEASGWLEDLESPAPASR
jgi:hypothetical protein